MLEKLREEAYKQMSKFSDANDAYEKRGLVAGVELVYSSLKSLYEEKNNATGSDYSSRSKRPSEPEPGPKQLEY